MMTMVKKDTMMMMMMVVMMMKIENEVEEEEAIDDDEYDDDDDEEEEYDNENYDDDGGGDGGCDNDDDDGGGGGDDDFPFPRRQILDSSKLKEFADDKFKFYENARKFSKIDKRHCGKRRNCSLRAISPFLTVFSKKLYCRHVKTSDCMGKG